MTDSKESRDVSLYNGISHRSRGWKSRKSENVPLKTVNPILKRWDGNKRTTLEWDGLRRDTELWFRHGNCFVYLHGQGQSRRGPAFKVPLSTLLAAQCRPFIEKFAFRDTSGKPEDDGRPSTRSSWSKSKISSRTELFIPPPPGADKTEILQYHISIRNMLAWVFRRRLVGGSLSLTLSNLFQTMSRFRAPEADHVQDFEGYLEDEGFLDMTGQPEYALAILHVAETMRQKDLYIEAFAHCVGMYNHLYLGPEYEHCSHASKKLLRRARLNMDLRLSAAGPMLSDFLEEDMSESRLSGLSGPARAHMDRFRTYIQGFYATRLGYYPPKSVDLRSIIFEPHVYRTMAADFQALYEYLVDRNSTAAFHNPYVVQEEVSVLHCIQTFDKQHNYTPLSHPLPLLPEATDKKVPDGAATKVVVQRGFGGKAVARFLPSRPSKMRPDSRLLSQAALLKATNKNRPELYRNDLVGAYRRFEEDSIFAPQKADKEEAVTMADGRKVRWILIYAVHQTLCNAYSPPPPQVRDAERIPYHMGINTAEANLPPWSDSEDDKAADAFQPSHRLHQGISPSSASFAPSSPTSDLASLSDPESDSESNSENDLIIQSNSLSFPAAAKCHGQDLQHLHCVDNTDSENASPTKLELEPDIDYLGLSNRRNTIAVDLSGKVEVTMLPRSNSLVGSLSRNATFRRSLGLFRSGSHNKHSPTTSTSTSSPERVECNQWDFDVFGFGNATTAGGEGVQREENGEVQKEETEGKEEGEEKDKEQNLSSSAWPTDKFMPEIDKDHSDAGIATATTRTLSTLSSNSESSNTSATTALTAPSAAPKVPLRKEDLIPPPVSGVSSLAEQESGAMDNQPCKTYRTDTSGLGRLISSKQSISPHQNRTQRRPVLSIDTRRGRLFSEPVREAGGESDVSATAAAPPDVPRRRSLQAVITSLASVSSVIPMTPVSPATPRKSDASSPMDAAPAPIIPTHRDQLRRFSLSLFGGGGVDENMGIGIGIHDSPSPQRPGRPLSEVSMSTDLRRLPGWQRSFSSNNSISNGSPQRRPVSHHASSMPYPPLRHQNHQNLDLVHEALLAAHEPLAMSEKRHSMASSNQSSVTTPVSQSLHQDKDECADARVAARQKRHSSYHGYRYVDDDVKPEWEKFAMGLGGHTIPVSPRA